MYLRDNINIDKQGMVRMVTLKEDPKVTTRVISKTTNDDSYNDLAANDHD
jgi:hypothetical protein